MYNLIRIIISNNYIYYWSLKVIGILKGTRTGLPLCFPGVIFGSFAIIEDVPLFPGCERVKKSQRRKCFQEKMARHISKNFRYPEFAKRIGIEGRVYVQFIIDTDGSATGIRSRGPHKTLEREANRIIAKLPKMTPGKQRGRPVRVPFSIPITFKIPKNTEIN